MPLLCSTDPEQMDIFGGSYVPLPDETISPAQSDVTSPKKPSALLANRRDLDSPRHKSQLRFLLQTQTRPRPLNTYSWSAADCEAVLEGMLRHQLHLLNDERTTPDLRAELIEWVAAPKQSWEELKRSPFAFQVCCLAVGVDFEAMREHVLSIVAPELLENLD